MKKSRLIIVTLISLIVVGLFALPALAQTQTPVTATVDRNRLTTDEALVLTISIDSSAGRASQPTLPDLSGFQLVASSSSTQISLINGNMTRSVNYNYTLRPTRTGQLVINPITVQVGGQTYTTQPIAVEASQGTGQMQPAPNPGLPSMPSMPGFPNMNNLFRSLPGSRGSLPNSGGFADPAQPLDPADAPTELVGQDFFIEAEVDNANPFQGEQVLYTFRFYQAVSLYDQPEYKAPSFSGFWSEEISDRQSDYTIEAAGRPYRVTELQAVLFPTGVGEATIEKAQLTIPGDFFTRDQVLQTQPISLNVRPLPDNAPASFQGAVGQFAIQAQADTAETEVNETVTLNVALSGQGNMNALADPVWTEGPEWRAFDSEATVNTQFENGVLSGERLYERLLVPTQAGDLLLPAIEFSYFNPQTESYETVSTEPIIIRVMGNVGAGAVPAPSTGAGAGAGSVATVTAAAMPKVPELRPNKAVGELNSSSAPLTENGAYWLLWLVPVLLVAGYWGWQRYQQQRLETADSRRSSGAAKRANQALQAAGKQGDGSQAAGTILVTYLEEKMNQRVAGLSHTQMTTLLEQQGVDEELSGRVQDALMQAEMGRYAPSGINNVNGELLSETSQVIEELEKEL